MALLSDWEISSQFSNSFKSVSAKKYCAGAEFFSAASRNQWADKRSIPFRPSASYRMRSATSCRLSPVNNCDSVSPCPLVQQLQGARRQLTHEQRTEGRW